jgi:alcohol dehydrogenase class IV
MVCEMSPGPVAGEGEAQMTADAAQGVMLDMRKFVAPEFVFGLGASRLAGQYCRNLGARRPLVVTMPDLMGHDWFQAILAGLDEHGLEHALFSAVSENPRDFEVAQGAERYADQGCDAILAVGGGSAMDCAKGIGIVHANGQDVLEFAGVDMVARPGPPLVCVPTTAGSSADVSQFAIINDTARRVKVAIVSKTVVADTALVDPGVTLTMGRELTVHTGLDALTHAVEAYVSNANGPVTDLFALEAVRLVGAHLGAAADDGRDLDARAGMMLASMYAGLAFSNAILGAVHGMAHSLGGHSDLPHGMCNAILLDLVAAFNYDAAPGRYRDVAEALGRGLGMVPGPGREGVVEILRAFKRRLGVDKRLGELGVRREDLPRLAELAMQDPCMVTNPRKPTREEIEALYAQAF